MLIVLTLHINLVEMKFAKKMLWNRHAVIYFITVNCIRYVGYRYHLRFIPHPHFLIRVLSPTRIFSSVISHPPSVSAFYPYPTNNECTMVRIYSFGERWNVPINLASPPCLENSIFDLMKIFLPLQ